MTDRARPWQIDPGLASDLAAALGWSPEAGAAALAATLPMRVVGGTTAKLAAVAAGEVPPGADADDLCRRILGELTDDASRPAWSCWVFTSVFAALCERAVPGSAAVGASRRIDDASPVVDFHSVVEVDLGDGAFLCDPYFGVAVPVPATSGAADDVVTAHARTVATVGPDGRIVHEVTMGRWTDGLRYRLLAPSLDRGDVLAYCAVSATHSGVPARRHARLHLERELVDLTQADDGSTVLHRWPLPQVERSEAAHTVEHHPTWPAAAARFTELSGLELA